jgi:hypothetical protein
MRKSATGVVCQFIGAAITWFSQRQKMVTLSTTEAEFVAASKATKETFWLSLLLSELTELASVSLLYVDNTSTVKHVKNPVFHRRSKHTEMRYHFVREKYHEGKLLVEHVFGEDQIADRCRVQKLRDMIGLQTVIVT